MKIALVHKRYDRLGGAEWDCYESARQLAARGHEVHLVVGDCRLPVPKEMILHRVPVVRAGQLAKLLSFAFWAPRVWRRVDADVVVGFGRTFGHDLFRASGGCHRRYLERVVAERGVLAAARLRASPYQRALLAIERRQYAPAGYRRILTVSHHARAELLETYPAVPAGAVEVVHYGVDLGRFHPCDGDGERRRLRAELGLPLERPLVLFVGTGFRRKGVDTLLEIWGDDPPADAALVVVGNDQHLAARRRAAQRARAPVVFTGPRADVERFYSVADLFVLPSLYEAFGIVVLEALAAGLPVVTARALGAAEMLTGPLADLLIDDPRDAAALRACLVRALDPARRASLAAAAQAAAGAASLERAVTDLERWCRTTARDKGRAGV